MANKGETRNLPGGSGAAPDRLVADPQPGDLNSKPACAEIAGIGTPERHWTGQRRPGESLAAIDIRMEHASN